MSKLKSLFIGNCQNSGIIHFLSKSKEYTDTYDTKQYANWQMIANKDSIPTHDLLEADLFVFQPLKSVHGCYSTDPSVEGSLGSFIKPETITFSYPYVFNSYLWPIVQLDINTNKWIGGEVLDKLVQAGYGTKDIIYSYQSNNIDWDYDSRYRDSMNILKDKESITNLKISSFIEENQNKQLLALTAQHPTSIIFYTLANQILEQLNMKVLSDDVIDTINDTGLPDSAYGLIGNLHPLHISTILNFNLNYGSEYIQSSIGFYEKRILEYMIMNHPSI